MGCQSCGLKPKPWICEKHKTEQVEHLLGRINDSPAGFVIQDSGERKQFDSGSLRDTSTGKIDWTNVTHGPMLRRWAQDLTNAKTDKYPDAAPGVPNWTLINSREEFIRYRVSAFRHFMSWFFDETDEDHASACFFNINGVEYLKAKGVK